MPTVGSRYGFLRRKFILRLRNRTLLSFYKTHLYCYFLILISILCASSDSFFILAWISFIPHLTEHAITHPWWYWKWCISGGMHSTREHHKNTNNMELISLGIFVCSWQTLHVNTNVIPCCLIIEHTLGRNNEVKNECQLTILRGFFWSSGRRFCNLTIWEVKTKRKKLLRCIYFSGWFFWESA